METPMTETIMDHTFDNGFCTKCGRGRTELVAYGDPRVKIETGDSGLSCSRARANSTGNIASNSRRFPSSVSESVRL